VFCQEDAQASDGQNCATENTLRRAIAQRLSDFLLTTPGDEKRWLVCTLHDHVAVVLIPKGGIFHAGSGDIVPVLRDNQPFGQPVALLRTPYPARNRRLSGVRPRRKRSTKGRGWAARTPHSAWHHRGVIWTLVSSQLRRFGLNRIPLDARTPGPCPSSPRDRILCPRYRWRGDTSSCCPDPRPNARYRLYRIGTGYG